MRRTYKSKKDTAGGLDHRDAFLTMDEKSSAFDAFYIQNIKQTKREMSCMGSSNNHGVASSKVRKRKYVKRIVKDVEPILRESMSASAYLTPDKSLHVNKAPDLFDQLFNSSSRVDEPKRDKNEDVFENLPRKESKTYNRKKPLKKRFNYTSSDSTESDKENTKDVTTNSSNIKAHDLLIEKEAKPSPKFDESINKIVKNLSILNNLNKRSHNRSIVKTFGNNKNRLTKNFDLLRQENSPLCSTPFTEKQRSKSIYKFSPIPIGDLGDSPNYVTITEENNEVNDSIVFVPRNSSKQPITPPDDIQPSPITHITNRNSTKYKSNSKSLFSSHDSAQQCSIDYGEIQEQIKNKTNEEIVEKISKTQSSLQISEVEPFRGFSENTINKLTKINKQLIEDEKDKSIILPVSKTTKHSKSSEHSKIENEINSSYQQNSAVTTSTEYTIPSKPFLGFTNIETENLCSESEQDLLNTSSDVNDSVSSNSQEERQSLYDTCDSNNSFDEEKAAKPLVVIERMDTPIFHKCYKGMANYNSQIDHDKKKSAKPLVVIERMDTLLFQKYYEEMASRNSQDDIDDSADTSEDYATFESDKLVVDDEPETSSGNGIEEVPTEEANIESNDGKSDSSNISVDSDEETYVHDDLEVDEVTNNAIFDSFEVDSGEEKCISFVTTRRRKEITNNISILVLDDSRCSSSSTNCDNDKTVLSNKINNQNDDSLMKTEEIDKYYTLIDETGNNSFTTNTSEPVSIPDTRVSSITIRKSSEMRNSFKYKSPEHSIVELPDARLPIVLQPGKKWERSLSIYRRMTTINDHFDHSVLEDEDLLLKGRNYRQSVISTMKMQESQGLLHNESINSRRSTFVSKPSRSTIRIVKETNSSRVSLSNTTIFDDLKGFLEDCDDTIVELSKLSIAEDHEVTVLEKFHDSSRVATARDFVLRRCNQTDTILFDECYPETTLKNCRKIGEGVYGEVYLWRATDGRARVMKIVPIAGSIKVNGEHQKDFHEIISEIVIAMELSALRTPIDEIERHFDEGKDVETLDLHSVENATDVFNEVKAVRCVYGSYPSRLLDLWELYDECKGSENDNPAILPVDQQYIVLELANAGQDLESYQFNSAEQAHALFLQVAFGLAVGEEAFQFEHRDLHWGNVLIAPTEQKYATFVLRGRAHRVPRRGVAATIIDYSLSRLSLPLTGYESAAALYNDLSTDEGLFGAVGDYQFEVYRLMRDKLGNEWKNFEPYTNILWLHYTVDKMITALRYKRTNTKTHKQYIAKLKGIKERILHYGGATQFVLTDNEF